MSRTTRAWGLILAAAALLATLQIVNTLVVRGRACTALPPGSCTTATGVLGTRATWTHPAASESMTPSSIDIAFRSAMVRRTCDGGWTLGLGARVDTGAVTLRRGAVTAQVDGACADAGVRATAGALGAVRVTTGDCSLDLPTVTFADGDVVRAAVSATVATAARDACARLILPDGRGQLATLVADMTISAALTLGAMREGVGAAPGSAERLASLRGLLSSRPVALEISVVAGSGKASMDIRTEPDGESAVVSLSARADDTLAALVPADLRTDARAPVHLDARWHLDHASGTATINGTEIERHPLRPARGDGPVTLPASECGQLPAGGGRTLYFVEAGDDGEALAPAQIAAVFRAVENAARRQGALVSVFVHGWHHSAAVGDSFVCGFSDVLVSVHDMETRAAALAGRPARQIIGVYVGWPGALYPNELANSVTTFWNRLQTADRVGARGAALEQLLSGLATRVAPGRTGRSADRRSTFLVVGHSMGARAVFGALAPQLATTPADRAPDLVLLVNPAFSATQYRAAHERNRQCEASAMPLLLLSSLTDGVTRRLYPAGQSVSYRQDDAEPAPFLEYVSTAANFEEFVTHELQLEPVGGDPPAPDGPQSILRGFERVPAGSAELYADNPVTVYRQPAAGRPRPDAVWYRMRLTAIDEAAGACSDAARSQVVAVDSRILPDHGRIFTPPFVEYVVRVLNRRAGTGPRP
jgi:hypothetical protein